MSVVYLGSEKEREFQQITGSLNELCQNWSGLYFLLLRRLFTTEYVGFEKSLAEF